MQMQMARKVMVYGNREMGGKIMIIMAYRKKAILDAKIVILMIKIIFQMIHGLLLTINGILGKKYLMILIIMVFMIQANQL